VAYHGRVVRAPFRRRPSRALAAPLEATRPARRQRLPPVGETFEQVPLLPAGHARTPLPHVGSPISWRSSK